MNTTASEASSATQPHPLANLSGATRWIAIVGDPIAQVKSPAGVTRSLQAHGKDAIVVPVHVTPTDLSAFMEGASRIRNLDGIIVTVPHKFAMLAFCHTATEGARFLGAVNTLRRNPDGSWHGDMFDGLAFVSAIRQEGALLEGARVLLVGAGGAGSAIGWAALDAGAAALAVHDADPVRREALIQRLQTRHPGKLHHGSDDPTGFDIVINASWCGMKASDPMPVQVDKLQPHQFVGDVITAPAVTPMVQAARNIGCKTQIGTGMFAAVSELMVAFLLETHPA